MEDTTKIESGRWYPWSQKMINKHICCGCGLTHTIEIKTDSRGVVWMRWTVVENEKWAPDTPAPPAAS